MPNGFFVMRSKNPSTGSVKPDGVVVALSESVDGEQLPTVQVPGGIGGHGANSQSGAMRPTALPSGQTFASRVHATGCWGELKRHREIQPVSEMVAVISSSNKIRFMVISFYHR